MIKNKEAKMAAKKTTKSDKSELIEALDIIEKEKQISKEVILEAIENSLLAACKNQFGKSENIRVNVNRETGEVKVFAIKEVVDDDDLEDEATQMGITEAILVHDKTEIGDTVEVEVTPKNFGRIAAQKAKQVVVQKIREEERKVLYVQYLEKEREVITGIVQRYSGKNICVNLGKVDAILMESEQVKGEHFKPTEHIKLYVVEVKDTTKGPRITVSRSHPEFVKRLFEEEVTEIQDGTVEIRSIAREAGSRTKMAVSTDNPNVDAIGACVGINGSRVNAIVEELRGEKIDIINWSDSPAVLIENALSPSKVISVDVDEEEKTASVVVPQDQLSLAIGKEGQNVRLAARVSGWKIDIKSHSQYEAMTADEGSDYQIYEYDRQDTADDPGLTQDPVDDEVLGQQDTVQTDEDTEAEASSDQEDVQEPETAEEPVQEAGQQ